MSADAPLDLLARRSLDQIASTAAALLDVRLVVISVVKGPLQSFVGSHGHADELSPMCRDVATTGRPVVLQDARRRLPAHVRGTWEFGLVGYAGVPLPLQDATRVGAFAAITSVPRAWQDHDLHVLRCLASAAAAVLDMRALHDIVACMPVVEKIGTGSAMQRSSCERPRRSPRRLGS